MARKPDSFMPLWIADYAADTLHLTRDQHGGYLLLLMAYWRNGGPLQADDATLAGIVRASSTEWRKLKPVLQRFFVERDGLWTQKRADEELERAKRLVEARSAIGKMGGKASVESKQTGKQNSTDGSTDGSPDRQPNVKQNSTILPSPTTEEREASKQAREPAGATPNGTPEGLLAARIFKGLNMDASKAPPCLYAIGRHAVPWVTAGCDIDLDIVPAILGILRRDNGQPMPKSAKYFDPVVREAAQKRRSGEMVAEAVKLPPREYTAKWTSGDWRSALRMLQRGDGWSDRWGPRPGEPGCLVPQCYLDEPAFAKLNGHNINDIPYQVEA